MKKLAFFKKIRGNKPNTGYIYVDEKNNGLLHKMNYILKNFLFVLFFLPALTYSNPITYNAGSWIIEVSDTKDSSGSNCRAKSKYYPHISNNTETSIFIKQEEDNQRPIIIIEISKDKILETTHVSQKVIASLYRVNYQQNQKLFGDREGTQLFETTSSYATFIGNRGGKKIVRIGFYEELFRDYELRSKNSGQSENWEQLRVWVDTSKYLMDRNSTFDMSDFSVMVNQLLYCNQNLGDYKKKLNRIIYNAELKQKKEDAEEEARWKKIQEENARRELQKKINKERQKQQLKNQCLSRGIYWRWIDIEPYDGYCVNIFASGSASSYEENEDETEDEDELMDDSWFDEGTPQCDEGTWYEENGYC